MSRGPLLGESLEEEVEMAFLNPGRGTKDPVKFFDLDFDAITPSGSNLLEELRLDIRAVREA